MTRRRIEWIVGMAAVVVLGGFALTGKLLAQKAVVAPPEDRSLPVFVGGEGSWLGVELSDVNAETARQMKLPGEYGAVVNRVDEDSPAAKAGLKEHDVILEFNGQKVWSVAELSRMVRETPPGRSVTLKVSRDGALQDLTATLERREGGPGPFAWKAPEIPPIHLRGFDDGDFGMMIAGGPVLGIAGQTLTPQLARYFGVEGGKGVLVTEVMPGTPAEKAGLKAGDCIVRVGPNNIKSLGDLRDTLREDSENAPEGKRQISLTIVRNRQEQTLAVTLERSIRGSSETADAAAPGIEALTPEERAKIERSAGELRRELEQHLGELKAEAARSADAEAMARDLRRQWTGDSAEMRSQLEKLQQDALDLKGLQKQLQPEMERLRKDLEQELHSLRMRSDMV